MAIFLCSEAALFGTLIGTYFYLHFTSTEWPQDGIAAPSVALPLALTALLVASCAPMAAASRAAALGRGRAAWWLVAIAVALQAAYLGGQIASYVHDLGEFGPSTNAYGSIYFTLLAVHHAHVGVGVLLDGWLLTRLRGDLTEYRRGAVMAVALYWYFVSLAGLAVTATILIPAW